MPCRDEGAEGSTSVAGDLVGRGVIHTVQATGDEVEPEFGAGNETLHEYRRVPREQSAGPGPHRRRRAEPDQNEANIVRGILTAVQQKRRTAGPRPESAATSPAQPPDPP